MRTTELVLRTTTHGVGWVGAQNSTTKNQPSWCAAELLPQGAARADAQQTILMQLSAAEPLPWQGSLTLHQNSSSRSFVSAARALPLMGARLTLTKQSLPFRYSLGAAECSAPQAGSAHR
jgi:hypothetical protein